MKPILSFLFLMMILVSCTQAPQPYRHSRTGVDTTDLRLRDAGLVHIMPIEGVSIPMAQILSESLKDSLGVRNIPATTNQVANPSYRVRAQVIVDRSVKEGDTLGSIYWNFVDRTSKTIHESSQVIEATRFEWDYGDPDMVAKLVEEAADQFAGFLQDASEAEAVELAENQKDVEFFIEAINGARGDGDQALRKAMGLTLRQFGAVVRHVAGPETYRLSADIDILEPFEGKQRIKMAWIVRDAKGEELGRARQNNQMPEGRFDQKWGKLAYIISQGAMQGIGQIVERHRAEQYFERSRGEVPRTAAPGRRSGRGPAPF